MKIKAIINENYIKWLCESNKIVDKVDIISNQIIDDILKNLKNGIKRTEMYNVMGEKVNVNATQIFLKSYDISHDRNTTYISLDVWIFHCKSYDDYEYYLNNGVLNCGNKQDPRHPTIYLGFGEINGEYSRINLLTTIAHELTHTIQMSNNYKLKNDEYAKYYNKQYNNITKQYFQDDKYNTQFVDLCYFFTKSEVSANLNGLYVELVEKKGNKNNVHDLYLTTEFYREYKIVLGEYNELLSLSNDKWDVFRQIAQLHDFYKETMKLAKTPNGNIFKRHFCIFIDRMIKYTDEGIKIVLTKKFN
jgi:hypothetical protein